MKHTRFLFSIFFLLSCGADSLMSSLKEPHQESFQIELGGHSIEPGLRIVSSNARGMMTIAWTWRFIEADETSVTGAYDVVFSNFSWTSDTTGLSDIHGLLFVVTEIAFFDANGHELATDDLFENVVVYTNRNTTLSSDFALSIPLSVANQVASAKLSFTFPR